MTRAMITPSECPVCGESVPRGAKACPGCGADERSGWDDDATRYDGLDLPEDAFEDGDTPRSPARYQGGKLWIIVTLLLLVAVIFGFVLR
jgi:hypothetical protein